MIEIYAAVVSGMLAIFGAGGFAFARTLHEQRQELVEAGRKSSEAIIRLNDALQAGEKSISGIHSELKSLHGEIRDAHKDIYKRIEDLATRTVRVETQCVMKHGQHDSFT